MSRDRRCRRSRSRRPCVIRGAGRPPQVSPRPGSPFQRDVVVANFQVALAGLGVIGLDPTSDCRRPCGTSGLADQHPAVDDDHAAGRAADQPAIVGIRSSSSVMWVFHTSLPVRAHPGHRDSPEACSHRCCCPTGPSNGFLRWTDRGRGGAGRTQAVLPPQFAGLGVQRLDGVAGAPDEQDAAMDQRR